MQTFASDLDFVSCGQPDGKRCTLASVDFRRQLRGIQVPTLVLAGRFDRVGIPRYSVKIKTFMPQAQFVMFEKSGHMPFLEEPGLHDSIVGEFLHK